MAGRSLLVSDIDGTLLGDDQALERFAAWFAQQEGRMLLAYASGRFFDSVVESVRDSALPEPDAVIGGVGSEIVSFATESCVWSPAETVDDRWNPYGVRMALRYVDGLKLQPLKFQSPFKISFFMDDAGPGQLDDIERRLREATISADIIYSSNRHLDVLPTGVNKGSATERLAHWAGLGHGDVIVAGDTGNDLSMFERGFRGIVVANAEPVLRSLTGDTVYHAGGCYAAGVLEGVEHWLSEQEGHEPPGSGISEGGRGPAHERHAAGVQRL